MDDFTQAIENAPWKEDTPFQISKHPSATTGCPPNQDSLPTPTTQKYQLKKKRFTYSFIYLFLKKKNELPVDVQVVMGCR